MTTEEITKAIVPLGGLATRFLPVSRVLPKEFLPLADKPLLHYALEELKNAGIREVVFIVNSRSKEAILHYFRRDTELEKVLEERKRDELLELLKDIDALGKAMHFLYVQQKEPLGDGHAVLQAAKLVGDNAFVLLYPDDVIESKIPCTAQLMRVYKTAQKPVQALYRLKKEQLSGYGVVGIETIAHRLYKIKKIVEKPSSPEAIPSDLAVVGRRILTSEVFEYLKKAHPNKKGEIVLSEVLGEMVRDGKIVYGYEIEGRWWECGTMEHWLRSQTYFTLKHPEYGKNIQKFLKEEKLL